MSEEEFYLEDLRSKFAKIDPSRYFLSYSGGKDSHLLYWFIKKYAKIEGITIVGINTFMEHTEMLMRMRKNSDVMLHPIMKPLEIKEKYGIPCFSKMQDNYIMRYQNGSRAKYTMDRFVPGTTYIGKNGVERPTRFKVNQKASKLVLSGELHKVSPKCCWYMKREPSERYKKETGRQAILGVRGKESFLRSVKYKNCFMKEKDHELPLFTPIHDLSDELLEKIYKKYNIEIPDLYKKVERTGCMGCPYGFRGGGIEDNLALLNDAQRKYIIAYFKESYDVLGVNYEDYQKNIFDYEGV
jgi:3'-phosphoadenosine 5'-phosphosulfate sulfotransferase (PAPS reductase)/FAD synthetase